MEIFAINNKPNLNKAQPKKTNLLSNKATSFQETAENLDKSSALEEAGIESASQVLRLNTPNPFLVLNEIDNAAREKEILAKDGGALLKALSDIRFGIINQEFTKSHLQTLQYLLNSPAYNFSTPELSQLINDIRLRAAVELAKLEQNLEERF